MDELWTAMDLSMWGPLAIAAPALAVLTAIHVVRTGRSLYWVWIILLFPIAGPLVYILAEVLPYMGPVHIGNPVGWLLDRLIPGRELARLTEDVARSPSVVHRQALAEYHVRQQAYPEAIALYEACLTGVYKDDPGLRVDLARVRFLAGQLKPAKALLEANLAEAPLHEPQKRDFLLARIAEEQGDRKRAIEIYDRMRANGPVTEEARVRLALLLEEKGDRARAKELYTDVVRRMRTANNTYRREQKAWLLKARQRLKEQAS